MFWFIWLPIGVFILLTLLLVYFYIKEKGGWEDFFKSILVIAFISGIIALIALFISAFVSLAVPATSVYADVQNPVFLVQIPENKNNKYLISTEDLKQGERISYYFKNPETGIPEQDLINRNQARLVFDNPQNPFYAEIKYICPISKFWLFDCTNTSPYLLEFHLPENSILK